MKKTDQIPDDGEMLGMIHEEKNGLVRFKIVRVTLHDQDDGFEVLAELPWFTEFEFAKSYSQAEYFVFYANRYGFKHPEDPTGNGLDGVPDGVGVLVAEPEYSEPLDS